MGFFDGLFKRKIAAPKPAHDIDSLPASLPDNVQSNVIDKAEIEKDELSADKPEEFNLAELSGQNVDEWVTIMKQNKIPLQIIETELNAKSLAIEDFQVKLAYFRAAEKIMHQMVERNLKGQEYEKADKEDKAIRLYEANVVERVNGSHPYERLRIIYTRKEKYKDAIRVCEAYILYGQHDPALKDKYERVIKDLSSKLNKL